MASQIVNVLFSVQQQNVQLFGRDLNSTLMLNESSDCLQRKKNIVIEHL